MSQHTPDSFDDLNDSFPPSIGDDGPSPFDQGPFDDNLFASYSQAPNHTPSNTACSEEFNDLDVKYPFTITNTPSSGDSNGISTPDFSGYAFGHRPQTPAPPSIYPPTPSPEIQHQYLSQTNQHITYTNVNPHLLHRPVHVRSSTNTDSLRPPVHYAPRGRINQPSHRRSLSQGDANRIATAANPTFFRLQAPRAHARRSRSNAPRDEERNVEWMGTPPQERARKTRKKHRANPSTDVLPYILSSSLPHQHATFSGPYVLNPIGTQINYMGMDARMNTHVQTDENRRIQLTGPGFKYMSHEEQLSKSLRIIEVGAMGVVNKGAGQHVSGTNRDVQTTDDVLKMVNDVETHLKQNQGDASKGLKGCEMIREALSESQDVAEETAVTDRPQT